ncbi:MAG TPA: TatD family hydrolase [Candidatus Paceibacterota bacterium]|nr:TatD family hydrolase [Verrucomicrobiota bacterium]HRY47539.1 TatD family hydrolase [Candidatus Paceibacterota bacterium]HSA02545.1 TatD family hydrolase [Candidatus Paceibacterota bacterium]
MRFYDTHAHLDSGDFSSDLPQVIERARAAGIDRIITIGTDLASSEQAVRLSEQYDDLFAAVGWHPNDASTAPDDVRAVLRPLARHPKVVAIGEIGLDYYRLPGRPPREQLPENQPRIEKQKNLFRQQLELAIELGLNCVVHQRDALEDTLALFGSYANRTRAVFHCYANDQPTLERILALGSLVSYTGILTYKTADNVRQCLTATPDGQFMLETDCPYLSPVPYRGQRCEPAFVRTTAEAAAALRRCSLEHLSAITCATADAFFRRGTPR